MPYRSHWFLKIENIRVQGSTPGAGDSSTPSKSAKSGSSCDELAQAKNETPDPCLDSSSQPFASWIEEEEINLRPQTDKGKTKVDTNEIVISPFRFINRSGKIEIQDRNSVTCRVDISGKYTRIWMRPNAHPKDVKFLVVVTMQLQYFKPYSKTSVTVRPLYLTEAIIALQQAVRKSQNLERTFVQDLTRSILRKQAQVVRNHISHVFPEDPRKAKDSPTKIKKTCDQTLQDPSLIQWKTRPPNEY
ncbi:hypothetical protein F511_10374 [Dorcoceras hygrometricum]|uniref:Uncharacterized protein n=1 Tax=Dorcoceras hygrometricum TaxID=472368 RepID=A0A2Z7CGQ7_9LAMI|nr:hypothetical protein F511_10374 [Dorcoceras hygrometricum]